MIIGSYTTNAYIRPSFFTLIIWPQTPTLNAVKLSKHQHEHTTFIIVTSTWTKIPILCFQTCSALLRIACSLRLCAYLRLEDLNRYNRYMTWRFFLSHRFLSLAQKHHCNNRQDKTCHCALSWQQRSNQHQQRSAAKRSKALLILENALLLSLAFPLLARCCRILPPPVTQSPPMMWSEVKWTIFLPM